MAGKKKREVKKKELYKRAAPIPVGTVIENDIYKKKWQIGSSIGAGGFGDIYSACEVKAPGQRGDFPYAIKIEPLENGPLFVENHFYIKNAKKEEVTKYMKTKKLTNLGMPTLVGIGTKEINNVRYRYLVLDRYGKDVMSLFKENQRSFSPVTVFQIGLQMLDVLEYLHGRGYVHADLKGSNMLLGLKKSTENQVYLVDYGLANPVSLNMPFQPDPKSAHNGTLEYTSRDAHLGVPTMRGDLEILGYNMLQWIIGTLPWESEKVPAKVERLKKSFMEDVRSNITKDYDNVPDVLIEYLEYVDKLKPKEIPDYGKLRSMFLEYLKSQGKTSSSKLEFTSHVQNKQKSKNVVSKKKESVAAPKSSEDNNDASDNDSEETSAKENIDEVKPKRGKRTTAKVIKRKSKEPIFVEQRKKPKFSPKATPPPKKDHTHTYTQTSSSLRRSERNKPSADGTPVAVTSLESESSPDIFEDSFEEKPKKKLPKRKLLSEDVVEKKVVRKVVTKGKSWKDAPAVKNGYAPPK